MVSLNLGSMEHLTREQMAEVLDTARKVSERDYLMILLAYHDGLRASELCSLKVSQFDVTSEAVILNIQRLKGSARTKHKLIPKVREAVSAWIQGKGRNEYVFPGKKVGTHLTRVMFNLLFHRHCEAAGIPEHLSHPHVLKHSIAMHTIQKAGINHTQQFLGHKNIQSTAAYLKSDDQQASAAVAAALGLGVPR
jgi:integrase